MPEEFLKKKVNKGNKNTQHRHGHGHGHEEQERHITLNGASLPVLSTLGKSGRAGTPTGPIGPKNHIIVYIQADRGWIFFVQLHFKTPKTHTCL